MMSRHGKQGKQRLTSSLVLGGGLLALGALALPACGEGEDGPSVQDVHVDGALGLGASGPAVAAAQDYLRAHGYFPNDKLAAQYPSWRPVVSEEPSRRDLLDAKMQLALSKLQVNMGLPATGTLTAETLDIMKQPRCGVPDTDRAASARVDKFALYPAGNRWTKTNITYRFASAGGLNTWNQAQARALISQGIHAWEPYINLTFTEVTSGGDFAITFQNIDNAGNILAQGGPPPSPGLWFDTSEPWSPTSIVAVATHEMGHLIGIDHSSFGSSTLGFPVMHPINHNVLTLTDDDIIGANAIYQNWTGVTGRAIDIGANSIAGINGEVVWILGTDKVPYKWNGSGWTAVTGVTGNRIDVDPQGHAVVIGTDGRIYRHQGFVGGPVWVELPGGGRGKDVGVGQNGSIYIIGNDNLAWVFNSGAGGWSFVGGPANQIAIDVSPNGQPFVVTSNNQLWVLGNGWVQMSTGIGPDVGIGGKLNGPGTRSWMFVLGTNNAPFLYDNQPGLTVPGSGAPATNTWIGMNGIATRITAGARGKAWVVNSANQIYFRTEMP